MWRPRVTVASIVEDQGKFLMVEELIDSKRVFNQPAGHLDPGESLVEAAVRETLEETAWTIEPQALVGLYRWVHPESHITFLRCTIAAKVLSHDARRKLDVEIQQVHWLTMDAIQQKGSRLRSPLVLSCLEDHLAGKHYPLDILADIS